MMTKIYKSHTGLSLRARALRWWSADTPARRGAVLVRAGFGGIIAAGLLMGMPAVSNMNADRLDAQQFHERNLRLAKAQDAGEVLRNDANASTLLQHDWLRSVEYSLERDPASALSRYASFERDRAALDGLESFQVAHMAQAEEMSREAKCLAQAVYYEARSEKTAGQLAVAEVVMNRVMDHRYPNTICDVVFQGATRTTGCQFTFTCDGAMRKTPRGVKWTKAKTIAAHVLMGLNEQKTKGATHYHATYVDPVWNAGLVKTRQIDTHIFYRFPRGGEWASARVAQARKLAQRRSGLTTLAPGEAAPEGEAKLIKTSMVPATTEDLNALQQNSLTAPEPDVSAPAEDAGEQEPEITVSSNEAVPASVLAQ